MNTTTLTAKQSEGLYEFVDHMLDFAEETGKKGNEQARKEGLPAASPEVMAQRPNIRPLVRDEMYESLSSQFSSLTSEEITKRLATVKAKLG